MSERKGFTLVEMVVAVMIFCLLLAGIWRFFSSGLRGTLHGQETMDHTRSAAILFRYIDQDVRGMIPFHVKTVQGTTGTRIAVNSDGFMFMTTSEGTLCSVRYSFDPVMKDVCREVLDLSGNPSKTESLGMGLFQSLETAEIGSDGTRFRVRTTLLGKLRTSSFERVFSMGFSDSREVSHWVFDNL